MSNANEDVLRLRLCLELSALRQHAAFLLSSESRNGREDAALVEESVLDQSDRDAIEAFFHSDDDFTRQFNEGTGNIKRTDLTAMDL